MNTRLHSFHLWKVCCCCTVLVYVLAAAMSLHQYSPDCAHIVLGEYIYPDASHNHHWRPCTNTLLAVSKTVWRTRRLNKADWAVIVMYVWTTKEG